MRDLILILMGAVLGLLTGYLMWKAPAPESSKMPMATVDVERPVQLSYRLRLQTGDEVKVWKETRWVPARIAQGETIDLPMENVKIREMVDYSFECIVRLPESGLKMMVPSHRLREVYK